MGQPVVYDYLDFRAFLKDLFVYNKERKGNFSYRFFSRQAGFASPNFLKLVTNGQRNLTNTSIAKIAKGFKLKKQESEFFEHLVFMNQGKTHDEKNRYYRKMLAVKEYINNHKIDKVKYEYFSKWYYPAIREIITFNDKHYTPGQIAERLNPKISPKEAERALKLLLELGLIKKDPEDHWQQCDKVVTTGAEVASHVIANFHKEMIALGAESIERFPSEERDITALTLSVRHDTLVNIKARIAAFRRELLELATEDENSDRVYQINFQLFPLTNNED